MVRVIGIAVVILGLIFQPLAVAVPNYMPVDDAAVAMHHGSADSQESGHEMAGDSSSPRAPCHEAADERGSPAPCADCDGDCGGGACASACFPGTPALLTPLQFAVDNFTAVHSAVVRAMLSQGHTARIFHPPRLA